MGRFAVAAAWIGKTDQDVKYYGMNKKGAAGYFKAGQRLRIVGSTKFNYEVEAVDSNGTVSKQHYFVDRARIQPMPPVSVLPPAEIPLSPTPAKAKQRVAEKAQKPTKPEKPAREEDPRNLREFQTFRMNDEDNKLYWLTGVNARAGTVTLRRVGAEEADEGTVSLSRFEEHARPHRALTEVKSAFTTVEGDQIEVKPGRQLIETAVSRDGKTATVIFADDPKAGLHKVKSGDLARNAKIVRESGGKVSNGIDDEKNDSTDLAGNLFRIKQDAASLKPEEGTIFTALGSGEPIENAPASVTLLFPSTETFGGEGREWIVEGQDGNGKSTGRMKMDISRLNEIVEADENTTVAWSKDDLSPAADQAEPPKDEPDPTEKLKESASSAKPGEHGAQGTAACLPKGYAFSGKEFSKKDCGKGAINGYDEPSVSAAERVKFHASLVSAANEVNKDGQRPLIHPALLEASLDLETNFKAGMINQTEVMSLRLALGTKVPDGTGKNGKPKFKVIPASFEKADEYAYRKKLDIPGKGIAQLSPAEAQLMGLNWLGKNGEQSGGGKSVFDKDVAILHMAQKFRKITKTDRQVSCFGKPVPITNYLFNRFPKDPEQNELELARSVLSIYNRGERVKLSIELYCNKPENKGHLPSTHGELWSTAATSGERASYKKSKMPGCAGSPFLEGHPKNRRHVFLGAGLCGKDGGYFGKFKGCYKQSADGKFSIDPLKKGC